MATDFTDEQLRNLEKYGFDRERFASWQARLRGDSKRAAAANLIDATRLAPPVDGDVAEMPRPGSEEHRKLEKLGAEAIARGELGLVVLNGGMATRFGGAVKGCVDVLPGESFLGLKIRDTMRTAERWSGRIPIYLMNSFATDAKTAEHLAEHGRFGLPEEDLEAFTQFVSVRMTPKGDVFHDRNGDLSWHGPGHGDFAEAIRRSGCLGRFRERGGKHLLVVNVDNLGARVSPAILGYHLAAKTQMTVEVAPKWEGDAGGSPLRVDDHLEIVEQLRYPPEFDPDVVDVFNTNTFHFDAETLDRDEPFDLAYYYVEKKVDDQVVVQFERLIGEMTRFLDSEYLRVPRTGHDSRFLPIKTPADLESARDEIQELYRELL
jgi:UTP--glucose-1-phosphate uridylyltransferase